MGRFFWMFESDTDISVGRFVVVWAILRNASHLVKHIGLGVKTIAMMEAGGNYFRNITSPPKTFYRRSLGIPVRFVTQHGGAFLIIKFR